MGPRRGTLSEEPARDRSLGVVEVHPNAPGASRAGRQSVVPMVPRIVPGIPKLDGRPRGEPSERPHDLGAGPDGNPRKNDHDRSGAPSRLPELPSSDPPGGDGPEVVGADHRDDDEPGGRQAPPMAFPIDRPCPLQGFFGDDEDVDPRLDRPPEPVLQGNDLEPAARVRRSQVAGERGPPRAVGSNPLPERLGVGREERGRRQPDPHLGGARECGRQQRLVPRVEPVERPAEDGGRRRLPHEPSARGGRS
jgi:hypothetical protein